MPAEILSTQDATLWWVQNLDAPLHIGAVAVFEAEPLRDESGELRHEDLRRHILAQLEHSPRFRQRLVELPLEQGLAWVDDEHFDIDHHLHVAALPHPGGDAELREFVSRLLETPVDPSRPLWEIWVVEGLADDRVAFIPKVNHVMADGMALLEFSLRLLDFEPRSHGGEEPADWTPEPTPSPRTLLTEGTVARTRHQVGALWRIASSLADPGLLAGAAASIGRMGRTGSGRAPGLSITRPVGPHRDFAWVQLPWTDLDRVKRAEGTTLNDVVLAISAGALAHYLEHAGDRLDGRTPRVLVPVSTHTSPGDEIENRFSMMVADIPVALADPLERLRAVHAEMERHKQSSQTSLGPLLFSLGDLLPPWVLRVAAPPILRSQPFVNLAVSNMPGSRDPMYLLGSPMVELYPYICGVGNMAVIIGVLSYEDSLGVGVTVDADVVPDADVLVEGLERSADELIRAIGKKPRTTSAGQRRRSRSSRAGSERPSS